MPPTSATLTDRSDAVGYASDALEPGEPAQARPKTPAITMTQLLGSPRPGRLDSVYGRIGRPLLMGLVAALITLPAFLLILGISLVNLAVFRSPRKVFFRQERMGRYGRPFLLVKFRTMWDDDHRRSEWGSDESHRVTPVGGFLRKSHLDELPQLWNILRGDMDVVGPRPEMFKAHSWAVKHVPGFQARLWVRPGITGLAQIRGGYASAEVEAYAEKLRDDLDYMARFTLRQDLAILFKTPIWMLALKGWGGHDEERRPALGRILGLLLLASLVVAMGCQIAL